MKTRAFKDWKKRQAHRRARAEMPMATPRPRLKTGAEMLLEALILIEAMRRVPALRGKI